LGNYYFKNDFKFKTFEQSFGLISKFYAQAKDIVGFNVPEKNIEDINTYFEA